MMRILKGTQKRPTVLIFATASFLAVALLYAQTVEGNAALPKVGQEQAEMHDFATPDELFEAYSLAANEAAVCMRNAGLEVDGPILEPNRTFSFIVTHTGLDSIGSDNDAYQSCWQLHLAELEPAWASEIFDPEEEETFNVILLTCLQKQGIDAVNAEDFRWAVSEHTEVFDGCTFEAINATEGGFDE
jgi:hypothetical protein